MGGANAGRVGAQVNERAGQAVAPVVAWTPRDGGDAALGVAVGMSPMAPASEDADPGPSVSALQVRAHAMRGGCHGWFTGGEMTRARPARPAQKRLWRMLRPDSSTREARTVRTFHEQMSTSLGRSAADRLASTQTFIMQLAVRRGRARACGCAWCLGGCLSVVVAGVDR